MNKSYKTTLEQIPNEILQGYKEKTLLKHRYCILDYDNEKNNS